MRVVVGGIFHKGLLQREAFLAISLSDGHFASLYVHRFVGQADNSFNKEFSRVIGVSENSYVVSLNIAELVGYFINNQVVPVFKGWHHGISRDDERLGDEKAYGNDNNQ